MIVEHRGEVLGHTRHASRADGFDARLFKGLKNTARIRIDRHQAAMHRIVMARQPQRDGIGVAAHDRRIPRVEFARWLRQARLARNHAGALGGRRWRARPPSPRA